MAAAVKEPKLKAKRIETAIDKKRKKMQLPPKHEAEEEYDSDTEDAKSEDQTSDVSKAGLPVSSSEKKPKLACSSEKKPKLASSVDKKPKQEPVEPSPARCPRGPTKPMHKGNSPRKADVLKAPEVTKVDPSPVEPKKDPRPSQDVAKARISNGKDKSTEAAPSPAPPPPAVRPAARPAAPPAARPAAPPPAPRAAPAVSPPVPDHLRKPWKRCAAHVYIAHFIDWQQNLKHEHTSKYPSVPWSPPPFHFNLPGFNEARARLPKPSSSPRKPVGAAGGVSTPKKGGPSGRASSSKAPPPEMNGGGGGGLPGSSRGGGGMGPPGQSSMSEQQRYASQLQQLALQQQLQGGNFPFPFAGGMPGFPPGSPYPQHHGSGGMPPGANHPSFYGGQPPLGLGLHHMGPHPSGAVHLGMEGGKAHKGDPRDPGAAELARRFASSAAQQEMLAKHGQPPGLDRGGFPMGADMKHLTPEMLYGMVNAANGAGPPRGMPPHGQEHRMRSLYGSGEPPHGFRTKGHA